MLIIAYARFLRKILFDFLYLERFRRGKGTRSPAASGSVFFRTNHNAVLYTSYILYIYFHRFGCYSIIEIPQAAHALPYYTAAAY